MKNATLPPEVPSRGNAFSRWVGRTGMRLAGWGFENEFTNVGKAVAIVAPHTSNWDFPVGVFAMLALGLKVSYLGKHTLFRGPLRGAMLWLGGIPVDRSRSHGVVGEVVARFKATDRMLLVLAPEGTRKKVPEWKSGFYHIAEAGGAGIMPIWFDYSKKLIGSGPSLTPSGDYESDLPKLKGYFRREMAQRLENY